MAVRIIPASYVSWLSLFLFCVGEPMAIWLRRFWRKAKHTIPVQTGFLSAVCCSNCLWGRFKISILIQNEKIATTNTVIWLFWFALREFQCVVLMWNFDKNLFPESKPTKTPFWTNIPNWGSLSYMGNKVRLLRKLYGTVHCIPKAVMWHWKGGLKLLGQWQERFE